MQDKEREQFSFINEKIKEKPLNKKRLLFRMGFCVGMAVVFGLVAALVFTYFQPKFQKLMYPEQKPTVTIPRDETLETETTEEADHTEASEEPETETEASQMPETEQQMTEQPEEWELELEDFQALQNKLYAVGKEVNKSIVTVTGVRSDTDWFKNPYESKGQASGIIVAENGRELLILTERKVIADVEEIYVTFMDDFQVEASMKKYDGNTGIAILSVPIENVDKATLDAIQVAVLGNSFTTTQGTVAIAVGSPLGTNYSILTGNITSTTNSISTIDSNYTVFTTDIVGSSSGSGALVNVNGEIIGLVMQDYSSAGDENTLTALAISEIKAVIEMLSNGRDIPYIGLELTTVTNDIAKEYDMPKGAYIKEVEMDSPAMAAGLQSGDVLTKIDGESVFNVDGYESRLLSMNPGDTVEITIERQVTEGYTEITCTVEVSVLK